MVYITWMDRIKVSLSKCLNDFIWQLRNCSSLLNTITSIISRKCQGLQSKTFQSHFLVVYFKKKKRHWDSWVRDSKSQNALLQRVKKTTDWLLILIETPYFSSILTGVYFFGFRWQPVLTHRNLQVREVGHGVYATWRWKMKSSRQIERLSLFLC